MRLFLCVRNFAWEIKLDLELADGESGAWDVDCSLGWQGSSVPADRTEAWVRCCSGRWVDLTCLPPALAVLGTQKSENDSVTGRTGGGEGQTGGEDPGVLTPCPEPLWARSCFVLMTGQGWRGERSWVPGCSAGRMWELGASLAAFPFPLPAAPLLSPRGNQAEHSPLPTLPCV